MSRMRDTPGGEAPPGVSPRGGTPPLRRHLATLAVLALVLSACNPIYVARAGWAQARILSSRVPLTEVMTDPATDPVTRGKLRLAWDARQFAIDSLGFRNAGDAYTTLAELPSDTLALVLSAAHRDRLAFRTWWFPIAGRVPYRAYFSTSAAERARDTLEAEGFDTWLRPTAAFSTLGWFADPLYSSLLRLDEVALVETILHELAHNHLYLPGHSRFNESWATFAGFVGAIEFFCRREGGGPDTVRCLRARERWEDAMIVSRWVDGLEEEIRSFYAASDPTSEGFLEERDAVYAEGHRRFAEEVRPSLLHGGYDYLGREPLNNVTLLSRSLYFHRLPDFDALRADEGADLREVFTRIRVEAPGMTDPFDLLVLARDD